MIMDGSEKKKSLKEGNKANMRACGPGFIVDAVLPAF